jgi:c(7)-type cytochrome triheme protein
VRLRLVVAAVALALPRPGPGKMPVFPEPASPEAYGRVVLGALSARAGVPAVTFDHWRHRTMFSCRPCHVDAGFAMEAGASGVSRSTNASGLHCGACHDGAKTYDGRTIFRACSASGPFAAEGCARCHSNGAAPSRSEYDAFTEKLPLYAGRYVDWEAAEARGLVKPLDFVEGLSSRRDVMKIDVDVPLRAKGTWLGDVTFSHAKHAIWSGCEACHPEIFPSTRRGSAKIDMAAIDAGKFCGVCHGTVAFPVAQCQRCHGTGMRGRGPTPVKF